MLSCGWCTLYLLIFMHLFELIDRLMHLKSILTKNLDKFKSINRLRTATHLLGTCCNCTCCWFIYFWYRLFCFGFFVARHQVSQKTAPHVRLPKLRLKLEDAKKNWACAATPKTLTEIRLPLALSLSLSCSFFFALPLSIYLSYCVLCVEFSSAWLSVSFWFRFHLSASTRTESESGLESGLRVWVSLWVEIECCSCSS